MPHITVLLFHLRFIDEVLWEYHTYTVVLVIDKPDSHAWETGTPSENDGKVLTFYLYTEVNKRVSVPPQITILACAVFIMQL